MKTPTMSAALALLRALEAKAQEENAIAQKKYVQEKQIHAARLKAAEKKLRKELEKDPNRALTDFSSPDEPKPPAKHRHIVNDATYEALGEILRDNPNGVLAYRDELLAMLSPLDREENAPARGFYLSAWGGKEGHTFDRIMRGQTHIPACCLSVLGSTQPAKFSAYLRRMSEVGTTDDGLIQRFSMLVYPDISSHWENIDRNGDEEARVRANLVFKRLCDLTPDDVSAEHGDPVPFLRFAPDAQERFNRWHEALEHRLRSGDLHPMLEGHFAKYRKLVPALSLIFHLIDHRRGPIGLEAVEQAIAWAQFLEPHAVRAYAAAAQPEIFAAKQILRRIKSGDLQDGFTTRDIQRRDWTGLTDRGAVERGLGLLIEFDWLRRHTASPHGGGRPSTRHLINPVALGQQMAAARPPRGATDNTDETPRFH